MRRAAQTGAGGRGDHEDDGDRLDRARDLGEDDGAREGGNRGLQAEQDPDCRGRELPERHDEHGRRRLPQADDEGSAQERRAASARSTSEESLK
jgi:hypothetical protein